MAAGPLIGGAVTTYLTWRLVFAGEVVVVGVILALTRRIHDTPPVGRVHLDVPGVVLSATGLGLVVFGVLRAGAWGWVRPKPDAPSVLGLSGTIWLILVGLIVLRLFLAWQNHLVDKGGEPLVTPELLRNTRVVGGLTMFFFQFLVQAGLFFTVPLYLSVALGLSALDTGVRLLPLSVTLLLAAVGVPRFLPQASPRRIVTWGLLGLIAGIVSLIAALDVGSGPEIVTVPLLLVGLGVGALASQLGAITVSSAPERLTGEVGGVQNTMTNLGASLGTALAGSILIGGLTASFLAGIEANKAVPQEVAATAQTQLSSGIPFLSDAQLEDALTEADVPGDVASAVVEENTKARIVALRASLAAIALVAGLALFFTRLLPTRPIAGDTPELPEGAGAT